jgi:hypothetical protein
MNNEIHSLVDFGSARTTRSTKWRHPTAGISFIHSSIHQTYILAVHASIHEQILLCLSRPLGSLCISPTPILARTRSRACLSVQRRVEGFIAIHAVSVLALVSTCYKCKCGICIILYFSTSMKSTKVSHPMPLVRGNSRWLLYFRLMLGLGGRGLLPVHQPFAPSENVRRDVP